MARDDNIKKWFTISEFVDIETGEMIQKYLIEQGQYYITKKEIKHEVNKEQNVGYKIITNRCIPTGQTKLF